MSPTIPYSSNALFRATIKTLVFGLSSLAAIVCASVGYGLLKLLFSAISAGETIRIAEGLTHSGITIGFFVLAGISAHLAKKCFW